MNTADENSAIHLPSETDGVILNLILGQPKPSASGDAVFRSADVSSMSAMGRVMIGDSIDVSTENSPQLFVRTITNLPNEPYELVKNISILIEGTAPGEFMASFREANIAASGDSLEEAEEILKAHILDVYELLKEEEPGQLGPGPRQQLDVLRSFLRERRADQQGR